MNVPIKVALYIKVRIVRREIKAGNVSSVMIMGIKRVNVKARILRKVERVMLLGRIR